MALAPEPTAAAQSEREPPVLAIERLARRFGSRDVVKQFDLELGKGRRVALRGPNGSGKTTILRCVAGTLAATAGTVRVAGYAAGTVTARRHVGASFAQERSFYLRLTGRNNLLFYSRLRAPTDRAARADVDTIAAELQIGHLLDQTVNRYSTGMVQQLGFARALLGTPELLLLDEPTRSMDDAAVERLWTALDRRSGVAVLIATHRSSDVDRCHDEIWLPS
jgi:ABC-type multidrug transport system ATPase subunit